MVWSRCHDDEAQPLQPNARSWPLPWIRGCVMVEGDEQDGWRHAADEEKGEIVISAQYPYLALTVWQASGFGSSLWRYVA